MEATTLVDWIIFGAVYGVTVVTLDAIGCAACRWWRNRHG